MANINKIGVYPFDTDVSVNDYLIGTDGDNNRKTKNFPIKSLSSIIIEQIIILSSKPVENRYITAPDNTVARMITLQAEQTEGFLQVVEDPNSETDSGYYEFLNNGLGTIEDYKKLTDQEVAIIENGSNWQIKTVNSIETSFADYTELNEGEVWVESNGTNITHIIFDRSYSGILAKAKALLVSEDFYLNIYNANKGTNARATIDSIVTVGVEGKQRVAVSGLSTIEISLNDVIHLGLPVNVSGDAPKEQAITGSRIDANVTGTYDIDLSLASVFRLTMTGNTTFSIINKPTGLNVKAFTLILDGDFVPALPSYCELTPTSDAYLGTVRNRLIFDIIEGTTASEEVIVSQENLDS